MHSIADVANYGYRLMELNRSGRTMRSGCGPDVSIPDHSCRKRDVAHPYGYAPLRYITADRSFVFLFFVGGALASELRTASDGDRSMAEL
eukprot:Skav223860  [mRNA]  locus=scaffold2304:657068:660110:- [translate_table: standard]